MPEALAIIEPVHHAFVIAAFIFVLIAGLTKLEIAWIAAPAFSLVFLFVLTLLTMQRGRASPAGLQPDVIVIGYQ